MNARSAVFDLFGDHLRERGGYAPVASIVRLLRPLDVAAPAVRTAISRMVRQGWLEPRSTPAGPGYAATDRARKRLDAASARIYRTTTRSWDGCWHLVSTARPASRSARDRIRVGLRFLGYAELEPQVWISAYPSPEVAGLLAGEHVRGECFTARYLGQDPALVARGWNLAELHRAYHQWLADATRIVVAVGAAPTEEAAFAARSRLVHEWRKFLFRDPALPRVLLPENWAGDTAATYFDAESSRLLPAAARYVDSCLEANRE
ncbi:MAG TPA: PaaX family transcriptional regulator C-terminal domain-containing protein [Mycobacteriales bacterium]|nr:PaaX family transcriptional regulator C-terminal domain-containing protein [Mycobacteriales bacterium]